MSSLPCSDCVSGSIHTGSPTGSTTILHSLPTYIAEPEGGAIPKGIIVYIPDAFGWNFVNNRLLCDRYAKKGGFLVYLPDFMNGKALASSQIHVMEKLTAPASWFVTIFYKPLWILEALYYTLPFFISNRPSITAPRIKSFITSLRTSPPPFPTPNLKIGAAGFCWGGKHVFLLCANTPSSRVHRHESQVNSSSIEPLIDCGFIVHPSLVSMPKDVDDVTLPVSVVVGNEDMAMDGTLIKQMKEILEVKKKGDNEVHILLGAKHGFAVRTNPEEPFQMECADKAEAQAIDWFTRWFS